MSPWALLAAAGCVEVLVAIFRTRVLAPLFLIGVASLVLGLAMVLDEVLNDEGSE